jgi:hypothetical protein
VYVNQETQERERRRLRHISDAMRMDIDVSRVLVYV